MKKNMFKHLNKKVKKANIPPTEVQLGDEIFDYYCDQESCTRDRGGCFKVNFITNANKLLHDNMCMVLMLHREKTRILGKEDKNKFCLDIFRSHCTNINDVINSTAQNASALFGEICQSCPSDNSSSAGANHMSSSSSSTHPPPKKAKFDMDWNVQIDPGFLPDGKLKLSLCRKGLAFLYGVKEHSLKAVSTKMKAVNSSGILFVFLVEILVVISLTFNLI